MSLWPYLMLCLVMITVAARKWDLRHLRNRNHEENKDISEKLGQKTKYLEVEYSKVESERDSLETQVGSLKHDAIKRDTNHGATKAQLTSENEKRHEDKHSQQKQLEKKSEEVKQLEEEKRSQQKRLEEKSKLVKRFGENARGQEKKAGDKEKQGKTAEERLKMLQPKLEDLRIASQNLEESQRELAGKGNQHAECQLTSLKKEKNSKIKSATGGSEQELNFLIDEGKQHDADLKQLETKRERMENVRDATLEEVGASKEASKIIHDLEERVRLEEAAEEENQIVMEGALALNLKTEGACTPQLNTIEDSDEASDTEGVQDTAHMPKKAGRKRCHRRRKPRDPNRSLPTEAKTDSPLLQIQTTRSTLPEENVVPEDEVLSSDSIKGGIEEEASDPDEGPSELPNSNGPVKHRRPGKRNSKRDHKFEAEKRKRKRAEKKAGIVRPAGGVPKEIDEKK